MEEDHLLLLSVMEIEYAWSLNKGMTANNYSLQILVNREDKAHTTTTLTQMSGDAGTNGIKIGSDGGDYALSLDEVTITTNQKKDLNAIKDSRSL